jgi:ABC-type enterochelin transport system permease subunit
MIFAFVAGIMLGIQHSELTYAAAVIAVVIAVKTAIDVAWDKVPFLGLISPFVVYRHNLAQKGEATDYAWVSYALQMTVFGMVLGLVTYTLFFFVFTPSA